MLKYMKHEIIHSYRIYFIVFAAFFAMCLGLPFMDLLFNSINKYNTLNTGYLFIAVLSTYGILVALFIGVIYSFNQTMFRKPGYLTLTLPLKTYQIVLGKLLTSLIWMIVAYIVFLIALYFNGLVSMLLEVGYIFILNDIPVVSTFISIVEGQVTLVSVLSTFIEIMSIILSGLFISVSYFYAIVTFVHTKYVRKYRLIIGFIIFVITFYIGVNMVIGISNLTNATLAFVAFCLFFTVIFTAITIYLINYKVELD